MNEQKLQSKHFHILLLRNLQKNFYSRVFLSGKHVRNFVEYKTQSCECNFKSFKLQRVEQGNRFDEKSLLVCLYTKLRSIYWANIERKKHFVRLYLLSLFYCLLIFLQLGVIIENIIFQEVKSSCYVSRDMTILYSTLFNWSHIYQWQSTQII